LVAAKLWLPRFFVPDAVVRNQAGAARLDVAERAVAVVFHLEYLFGMVERFLSPGGCGWMRGSDIT
jgi:hypothetical protein